MIFAHFYISIQQIETSTAECRGITKLLLGESPYFVSCIPASYPTHCHNKIELMYCVRGKAKIIIEGEEYPLVAGSILFISSLAMHQAIGTKATKKALLSANAIWELNFWKSNLGLMADFIIEGTGVPEVLNTAADYLRNKGRLIFMSSHERCAKEFNFSPIFLKSLIW